MKIGFIGLLLAGSICWSACSSDEDKGEAPVEPKRELVLSSTAFQSSGKADFVLLNITSTGAWKAEIDESQKSWLTMTPESGDGTSKEKVKIYMTRNLESAQDVRKGVIKFRLVESDTVSEVFEVTQYSEYKLTTDSIALLKVADKLGRANWLRPWDTSKKMESWEGVYVDDVNNLNRIIGLVFDSTMNVSGELPEELGELTGLKNLGFTREKKLTGNFPVEALKKTAMEHMEIKGCSMGGLIPAALQDLQAMTALVVSYCQYTGFEDGWKGDFPNMTGFVITGNKFSGPLTRDLIRGMRALVVLDIKDNDFSGTVPSTFFVGMRNLLAFEMSGNQLSGDFPEEISGMAAYKQSEPQRFICPQRGVGFTEGTCFSVDYVPPTEE